jgi:hypothetical protein
MSSVRHSSRTPVPMAGGRSFCGRYGSLTVVFFLGCSSIFLLQRKQPELWSTPIYNPFTKSGELDPLESQKESNPATKTGSANINAAGITGVKVDAWKPSGVNKVEDNKISTSMQAANTVKMPARQPVLGAIPTKGAKPLFGVEHQGGDAIFALACKYPMVFYERFVGSLRKAKYTGDIVLAVSPLGKMLRGVQEYIQQTNVVAYAFEVDCKGKDNCRLMDEFLGYPDPRPYRTFANIRYALYEYWLQHYSRTSYILILDFRDTFFQLNPFGDLPPLPARKPTYDLRMFAESNKVKTIGTCVYNGFWVRKCFGPETIVPIKDFSVICSGSTMGSYDAISYYIGVMLRSMDTVKCWLKGIESDQGYQNYLFYYGFFDAPDGSRNATLFQQGEGVVNTVGAMNGFRVPKNKKGPLGTFWKARDESGWVINNDGTRSAVVHQWDRFYDELQPFIDNYTYTPQLGNATKVKPPR